MVPWWSVDCPTPQGGGPPPFGVGNVVAAPLISSITLSTAPFERVSANLIASFVCIFFPPGIAFPFSITTPGRLRIRSLQHSLGGVGHDDRSRRRENPRTMRVVHDAHDVLI